MQQTFQTLGAETRSRARLFLGPSAFFLASLSSATVANSDAHWQAPPCPLSQGRSVEVGPPPPPPASLSPCRVLKTGWGF